MQTARKRRILIADCCVEVLLALERMLEDAGFDTTTAWTGREVLGLIQSQTFDLVLVSKHLPDSECEDILKTLQQIGAGIPCIVMQPRTPESAELDALRAVGACDVVCQYSYYHIVGLVTDWLGWVKTAAAAHIA
jgi:DNA-binding response OmpR family regulator